MRFRQTQHLNVNALITPINVPTQRIIKSVLLSCFLCPPLAAHLHLSTICKHRCTCTDKEAIANPQAQIAVIFILSSSPGYVGLLVYVRVRESLYRPMSAIILLILPRRIFNLMSIIDGYSSKTRLCCNMPFRPFDNIDYRD